MTDAGGRSGLKRAFSIVAVLCAVAIGVGPVDAAGPSKKKPAAVTKKATAAAKSKPTRTAAAKSRLMAKKPAQPRHPVLNSRKPSARRVSIVLPGPRKRVPAIRETAVEPDLPGLLALKSSAVLVADHQDGHILYAKNTESVTPIASITKLMTAMVTLDRQLPLDEQITIDDNDVDTLKNTHSRLLLGTTLSRTDLLHVALMASENRAASALGRSYPGGIRAFVAAMNHKAAELGMFQTHFADATGLSTENVSSAQDLARMVRAAYRYPLIREYTTSTEYWVETIGGRGLQYRNSNGLVKSPDWSIGLSKTGYIAEAGRCLVMQAEIASRRVIIVLLDSSGKYTRIADAIRIKKWMENAGAEASRAAAGGSHARKPAQG